MMDEILREKPVEPGHRWTAEEVEERDRRHRARVKIAQATAEALNAYEEEVAAAEGRPDREHTKHYANGGTVRHEHVDGQITQTEPDGTEWLVTSGVGGGGLWYDGPDDYVGYYPE